MSLSEDRAAAVMSQLIEKGVDATRLSAHGFGLSTPVASNKTDAGRALNRRVQFEIVPEASVIPSEVEGFRSFVGFDFAQPERIRSTSFATIPQRAAVQGTAGAEGLR